MSKSPVLWGLAWLAAFALATPIEQTALTSVTKRDGGRVAVYFTDGKADDKLAVVVALRLVQMSLVYAAVYVVISGIKHADKAAAHMYGFLKRMVDKFEWDDDILKRVVFQTGPNIYDGGQPHEKWWAGDLKPQKSMGELEAQAAEEADDEDPGVSKFGKATIKDLNKYESADLYMIAPTKMPWLWDFFRDMDKGKISALFHLVGFNSRQKKPSTEEDIGSYHLVSQTQMMLHRRHPEAKFIVASNSATIDKTHKDSQPLSRVQKWLPARDLWLAIKYDPFWPNTLGYGRKFAPAESQELDKAIAASNLDEEGYIYEARMGNEEYCKTIDEVVQAALKNQDDCKKASFPHPLYTQRDCDKLKYALGREFGPLQNPAKKREPTVELGDANMSALFIMHQYFILAWEFHGLKLENIRFSNANPPDMYRYIMQKSQLKPKEDPRTDGEGKLLSNDVGAPIESEESLGFGIYGASTEICGKQIDKILRVKDKE